MPFFILKEYKMNPFFIYSCIALKELFQLNSFDSITDLDHLNLAAWWFGLKLKSIFANDTKNVALFKRDLKVLL